MVAVLLIAALSIAGGVWWLLDSTVRVSGYDDVVAELAATGEALASTREALLSEQVLTAELKAELKDGLPESELRARFAEADPAALLLGYFAGADPEIVRGQEWGKTWAGVIARDMAVGAINDPVATELYWRYLEGGVGEPFQDVAANEFLLQLVELTIEPILAGR